MFKERLLEKVNSGMENNGEGQWGSVVSSLSFLFCHL